MILVHRETIYSKEFVFVNFGNVRLGDHSFDHGDRCTVSKSKHRRRCQWRSRLKLTSEIEEEHFECCCWSPSLRGSIAVRGEDRNTPEQLDDVGTTSFASMSTIIHEKIDMTLIPPYYEELLEGIHLDHRKQRHQTVET